MSRQSIGGETPEDRIDADHSGVPDRTERDFAKDGEVQPTGADSHASRPHRPRTETPPDAGPEATGDDEGLESTREYRGTVVPPASN